MKRILCVAHSFGTFVQQDIEALEHRYVVRRFQWKGKLSALVLLFKVRRYDVVYCWFANDHAAIAALACRLWRKPCITVAGGVDVANDPDIGYGRGQQGLVQRRLTSLALHWSTVVLTVSPLTHSETRAWGPGINSMLVPLGVDVEMFEPRREDSKRRRPLVLLVASAPPGLGRRVELKGIRDFVYAARLLPGTDFVHVGELDAETYVKLKQKAGPNVRFIGLVRSRSLMACIMQECDVVCQPSYRESFGLALAEGASCGAVPVTTHNRIGVAAYLWPFLHPCHYADHVSLAHAIEAAAEMSQEEGIRQRMHGLVRQSISMERRKAVLLDVVEEVPDA